MRLPKSANDLVELDQSGLNRPYSLSHFSWWHTGWVITELTRPHSGMVALPAMFRRMDWDGSSRVMMLALQPNGIGGETPPSLVRLLGVGAVHVSVLSFCPPIRLLHIRMDTGDVAVMRFELDLDQRRAYENMFGRLLDAGELLGDVM